MIMISQKSTGILYNKNMQYEIFVFRVDMTLSRKRRVYYYDESLNHIASNFDGCGEVRLEEVILTNKRIEI